jgi:hypothetical protein
MSMRNAAFPLFFDGKELPTPFFRGASEAFDLSGTALSGDLRPVAFMISLAVLVAASHIFGYGHLVPFG